MEIDTHYLAASQAAATQMADLQSKKNQKAAGTEKIKGKSFFSSVEKAHIENQLVQEGLPPEIAGMDTEDAAVFLKDAADIAADELKDTPLPENYTNYKKKVSQFLKFMVKNNFDVTSRNRKRSRSGKQLEPHKQIQIINEKLDELAQWFLSSHKEPFKMLSKLEEIQGLIVDLMAV
ncbi:MAG: YaaR family protein [Treponema sp.]|nr:YaaR family protein [Treponema sp.]